MFYESLVSKNPKAFWASKVKGHATAEMVRDGTAKEVDKIGNDKADELVGRAIEGAVEERPNQDYIDKYRKQTAFYRTLRWRLAAE